MAAYTETEATTMLALYIEAEKAILKGQSYSIGDRALTRADLEEVAKQREFWRNELEKLQAGRTVPRVQAVIPRDS